MNHIYKNITLINKEGMSNVLREFFFIILCSIILFCAAGTINWINAWIYILLVFVLQIIQFHILIIYNPELINERGRLIRSETKQYEIYFVATYFTLTIINTIIAGFDVIRFQWTSLPFFLIYPGILLFIFSSFIGIWAMSINPFFAATQRIQTNNDHIVISSGPYKFIRHPGYLSWIVGALSYPLILGSLLCLIPVFLLIIFFIVRTYLEDTSLQTGLDGYYNYSKKTKYRLIPYIW